MDIKCKICGKKVGEVKGNINPNLDMVCGDCQEKYWEEQKKLRQDIEDKKDLFNKILNLQEADKNTLEKILKQLLK